MDATEALPLAEAFGDAGRKAFTETGQALEGVYIDAGENGLFSLGEFETLTALGLMEFVTPEEIADNVVREILSHPTGKDMVTALDAATMGPTYRAGRAAQHRDRPHGGAGGRGGHPIGGLRDARAARGCRSSSSRGRCCSRMCGTLTEASELDPEATAQRADALLQEDADLRQRMLSIGIPILLPDGERMLRGPEVKVRPEEGLPAGDPRLVERGWVDLRPSNWARWRTRCADLLREMRERPGVAQGSGGDHEYGDLSGAIRPGRFAAWIFRYEDKGERIKR